MVGRRHAQVRERPRGRFGSVCCQAVDASLRCGCVAKCFFSSLPTMSEPGTSGGSGAPSPEAVHFTAEQLALIDRLIAARVASSSVTTGGATAPGDPSTTTPSSFAGEYLLVAAPAVRKPRHRVATCFRLPTGGATAGPCVRPPPLRPGTVPEFCRRDYSGCSAGRVQTEAPRCHLLSAPHGGAAAGPFVHPPMLRSGAAPRWSLGAYLFFLALTAGSDALLHIFAMPSASGEATAGPSSLPAWPSVVSTPATTAPGSPAAQADLPGFGSVPPKLIKKILAKEYVAAARDLASGDGGLVLPLQAPAAQPSDRHQCLDRMLCHDGGYSLCGVPGKGPTLLRLPPHHNQGQQDLRERGVGLVRHGVSAPGSQSGFSGLGARRRSSLQRGVRWPRQTDSPLSILSGRYPLLAGVPPRSCRSPSGPRAGREPSGTPGGTSGQSRHLSTLQLPGWIQVSIPTVPVCTPMHKVQAPTPSVGVRRETPAVTCREPADNGGGPGRVSPTLVGLSVSSRRHSDPGGR